MLWSLKQNLLPNELLFAFLDDVYVVSRPTRTREVYNMLGVALEEQAGIKLHGGVMILGTPEGSDRFVEVATEERISEEARLWEALAWVPDALGKFFSNVQDQDATTSCAQCLRVSPPSARKLMTGE